MKNRETCQIINIHSIPYNSEKHYKYSKDLKWIDEIICELESEDKNTANSFFNVNLIITHKKDKQYGDHLLISAVVDAKYNEHCIKCAEAFPIELKYEFNCCFMDSKHENTPEFEKATSIFCKDIEMELYFYPDKNIDLKELIREHAFLHKPHLPIHKDGCLGLCPECGVNLNNDKCSSKCKKNLPNKS